MKRMILLSSLAVLVAQPACHSSSSSGSGNDSGTDGDTDTDTDTDSDADADSDTDTDTDSDTDTDTDDWCNCNEQPPESVGDCDAAADLPPATTAIAEASTVECWYDGPSTPEAAAEVEYVQESSVWVAVITGVVGWDDFVSKCIEYQSWLTEEDFPEVDFATQRVAYFYLQYEYDCTIDGSGAFATRVGDLEDDTVQINAYLYNTGTSHDPCLEGFGWEYWTTLVIDTTSEVRACGMLAIEPPPE